VGTTHPIFKKINLVEKMDFEVLPHGTVTLLGRLGYVLDHGRWVPADRGCIEWVEPDAPLPLLPEDMEG
jgi:hypothetical protein